jgi:hypothetical protein
LPVPLIQVERRQDTVLLAVNLQHRIEGILNISCASSSVSPSVINSGSAGEVTV